MKHQIQILLCGIIIIILSLIYVYVKYPLKTDLLLLLLCCIALILVSIGLITQNRIKIANDLLIIVVLFIIIALLIIEFKYEIGGGLTGLLVCTEGFLFRFFIIQKKSK